jgi:hypothetical protein
VYSTALALPQTSYAEDRKCPFAYSSGLHDGCTAVASCLLRQSSMLLRRDHHFLKVLSRADTKKGRVVTHICSR